MGNTTSEDLERFAGAAIRKEIVEIDGVQLTIVVIDANSFLYKGMPNEILVPNMFMHDVYERADPIDIWKRTKNDHLRPQWFAIDRMVARTFAMLYLKRRNVPSSVVKFKVKHTIRLLNMDKQMR